MGIDECAPKDQSICTNNIGSYTCRCKQGFIGDGRNCTSKSCFYFILTFYYLHLSFQIHVVFLSIKNPSYSKYTLFFLPFNSTKIDWTDKILRYF